MAGKVLISLSQLDMLAEHILIAARSGMDEKGLATRSSIKFETAPAATKAALDVVFGEDGWAPLQEWPRPDQMRPKETG